MNFIYGYSNLVQLRKLLVIALFLPLTGCSPWNPKPLNSIPVVWIALLQKKWGSVSSVKKIPHCDLKLIFSNHITERIIDTERWRIIIFARGMSPQGVIALFQIYHHWKWNDMLSENLRKCLLIEHNSLCCIKRNWNGMIENGKPCWFNIIWLRVSSLSKVIFPGGWQNVYPSWFKMENQLETVLPAFWVEL